MKRLLSALEELENIRKGSYLLLNLYSDGSGFVNTLDRPHAHVVEFNNLKDAYRKIKKLTKELEK